MPIRIWCCLNVVLAIPVWKTPTVNYSAVRRFACDDPRMVQHLRDHGFTVVKNVASHYDLSQAWDLLWELLSHLIGWEQAAPSTWTDEKLEKVSEGASRTGILTGHGLGQSNLSWLIRTLPRVRCAFRKIWSTDNLLTSFDGINIFRPWHHGFERTLGDWIHVDQGKRLQGFHAVQGFVSLTDQDETTGGLYVISGAHLNHSRIVSWHGWPGPPPEHNYYELPWWSDALRNPRRFVPCRQGDLVLWDSRTPHCAGPSLLTPHSPSTQLLRALVYVSMSPKEWATNEVLLARRLAFEQGLTTGHWPHLQPARTSTPLDWDRRSEPMPRFESIPDSWRSLIS